MIRRALPIVALFSLATACQGQSVNLFTVDDDIELGAQLAVEIEANPEEYPLLDRADWADAYAHLDRIVLEVLDADEVKHRDDFAWEIHLIDDPETLNAFAAPGGYIYVYTGLIEFLQTEDAFAGVIGHEIAHAAERHTTEQLTRIYGVQVLLEVMLGENRELLADIATGLAGLSFSRAHETEADEYSVRYLCDTVYAADGSAEFFEAIDNGLVPEFLSTHPSPDGRTEAVRALAVELGCDTTHYAGAQYDDFLDSLPQP